VNNLNVVKRKDVIQALFKTTLLKGKSSKVSKLSEVQLEQLKEILTQD